MHKRVDWSWKPLGWVQLFLGRPALWTARAESASQRVEQFVSRPCGMLLSIPLASCRQVPAWLPLTENVVMMPFYLNTVDWSQLIRWLSERVGKFKVSIAFMCTVGALNAAGSYYWGCINFAVFRNEVMQGNTCNAVSFYSGIFFIQSVIACFLHAWCLIKRHYFSASYNFLLSRKTQAAAFAVKFNRWIRHRGWI